MKKLSLYLVLIVSAFVSCDYGNESVLSDNPDVIKFIRSESFKEHTVDISELDLKTAKTIRSKSDKEVVYIPFLNNKKKYILAFKNEIDFQSLIVNVEVDDLIDTNDSFFKGELNANINFSRPNSQHTFSIINSKIVSLTNDDLNSNGRTNECRDSRDVLDCAARNIDAMGPISWFQCMVELIVCLAVEAADCYLLGCPNVKTLEEPNP